MPQIIPYLTVNDASAAGEFYKRAFDATETERHVAEDGKRLMHLALRIAGGTLMLADDFPEYNGGKASSPRALGGTPVTLTLECANVDQAWEMAVKAGATVKMPLADQFWGDRYGQLEDPFGHVWALYTPGAKEK